MKISIFMSSWPPGSDPNGIVTYGSHLIPALRELGHEVFVVTFNHKEPSDDPYLIDLNKYEPELTLWQRVRWKLFPSNALYRKVSSSILRALKEVNEKQHLDIFEIEESFGWSIPVSRLNFLPVVVRLHGPWFLTGRYNDPSDKNFNFTNREKHEGIGIRNADFITATSVKSLQVVKEHYHLTDIKSRIIPTPIKSADESHLWSFEKCDKNSFLFVGRFDKLKGGDLVLKAFAKLTEKNPNIRLTFVGPDHGIMNDNGELYHFERYFKEHFTEELRQKVDFKGKLNHKELMELRPKHFITISAAQYDTMGYMILEPMSLGCPIVATAVGGIPEFIRDKENALLVKSQDVDEMVSACQRLIDDPTLAVSIGRQAWEDCRRLYSPESVAKQTLMAYQEALDCFNKKRAARAGSSGRD